LDGYFTSVKKDPLKLQCNQEWPRVSGLQQKSLWLEHNSRGWRGLSVVTVAVTDAVGRMVPTADNLIHFELSGPGKIIGVGNGDAACHEPDVYFDQPDVRAVVLNDWRMAKVSALKERPEFAEVFDDSQWQKVNVRADDGPLRPGDMAVFRTQVRLSAADLAVDRANLNFGMIDDEGWVYVNAQLAATAPAE
jgi:beta-galactosidase